MHETAKKPVAGLALLIIALVLPTLVTWVYFDALSSQPPVAQQAAYIAGKLLQFALPLLVLYRLFCYPSRYRDGWPDDTTPRKRLSLWTGAASGLVIGAAILGLYYWFLLPSGIMDGPRQAAHSKLTEMGLASPAILVSVAIFYSLVHSGLEEYFWRWFVFRQLRAWMPVSSAALLSSFGFMAHHVLVLARYFGWQSFITYGFSIAVAVGGLIWAMLYLRSRSILGPWLSHALVDAAIFVVAFDLAFPGSVQVN